MAAWMSSAVISKLLTLMRRRALIATVAYAYTIRLDYHRLAVDVDHSHTPHFATVDRFLFLSRLASRSFVSKKQFCNSLARSTPFNRVSFPEQRDSRVSVVSDRRNVCKLRR